MLVKWSEQETELGVIGRVGENNTRKIEIDCAETLEKLPGAEIICVMLRPGDETPYTLPLEANGNKRTIVLTDTDLERRGTIRLELRAVEDGAVLKSAILRGTVADSIRGEGDAPGQPVRDILDRVDDTLKAAEATRKELETALGGVQGAVDAATGAADAATEAAEAAEETDTQIQAAEQGRVEAEKKREHATAAAVKSITDTVADVQNKLESGAFTGAPGAPGAPGKDGKDAPQIDDTTISDAAPWSSQHIVDMLCPPLEASGNPVTCYPVAGSTLGIKASWEPMQEGTGTPSPDNIRPIHGRTQVKVERCGENLLNITPFTKRTNQGITYEYVANGGVRISGTATSNVDSPTFAIGHLPPGKYYGLDMGTGIDASIVVQRNGSNLWLNAKNAIGILAGDITRYWCMIAKNGMTLDTTVYPYIVPGTSAPAKYAPYSGSTTTLTLPSTIYGGEVRTDGKGNEKIKIITLDGNKLKFYKRNKYLNLPMQSTPGISKNGIVCCSHLNSKLFGVNNTYDFIYLLDTDIIDLFASVDRLNTFISAQYAAGTPVQIAYKLATPIPFAATGGGAVKALPGANTILTDADAVTVTGRADPIHIIQQLQAASTASAQALEDDTMEITQEEAIQKENEKGMNE